MESATSWSQDLIAAEIRDRADFKAVVSLLEGGYMSAQWAVPNDQNCKLTEDWDF